MMTISAINLQGIDVSHNNGVIDWAQVAKSGVQFAIIRTGLGWGAPAVRDMQLEANVKGCEANNIPYGFYHYSYVSDTAGAVQEAKYCLNLIRDYKPTYPIYLDQEYASPIGRIDRNQYKQLRTDICKVWLDTIQDAGYYAALYSSTDWLDNWVFDDQLAAYDKWVAQYGQACTYKGSYGIWQYVGDEGTCPGVDGACDRNVSYKDYPAIIKAAGLNGLAPDQASGGIPIISLGDQLKQAQERIAELEKELATQEVIYQKWKEAIKSDIMALCSRI